MKHKFFLSMLHHFPLGSSVRAAFAAILMMVAVNATADIVGPNITSTFDNKDDAALEYKKTSYDPFTDCCVYEFNVKYYVNYGNGDSYFEGDTYLTIDGENVINLKNCSKLGTTDTDGLKDWQKNGGRVGSVGKGGFNNHTSVYVEFWDPWKGGYSAHWVTMRVIIERQWAHKRSFTIGVRGKWKFDGGSASDKHLTTTITAPNISWPSSGTIERAGNKKVKYTSAYLTPRTGKDQDGDGSFDWLYSIYLMKSAGNENAPWNSISSSSNYYAKLDASNGQTSLSTTVSGVDNYYPVTIYPCLELHSERNLKDKGDVSWKQNLNKFASSITVEGYARAANAKIDSYDSYSKKVNISWEAQTYNSKSSTNGRWYIFRKETGKSNTQVKLGETAYNKTSFSDTSGSLEYGKTYTYTVCFVPNGWTVNHEDDAAGLHTYVRYSLKREFKFTALTVEEDNGNFKLNWEHSNITDASNSKTYNLNVQRYDNALKKWDVLETLRINNSSISTGSYIDNQGLQARHSYKYRLMMNVQEMDFYSEEVTKMMSGSSISSFTASRGDYNNSVKLNWTVNQKGTSATDFTIQRRPLGMTGEEGWTVIHTLQGTATNYSYEDNTAQPGSFNEYRILLSENDESNKLSVSSTMTTDGFSLATGVVSGRIAYGTGTAVQDVKVTLRPSNADGNETENFRSLTLLGSSAGVQSVANADDLSKMIGGSFSAQMYVKPNNDSGRMNGDGTAYQLLNIRETFQVLLKYDAASESYLLGTKVNGTETWSSMSVPAHKWSHLTMVYDNTDKQVTFYVTTGDSTTASAPISATTQWKSGATATLTLGNNHNFNAGKPFQGSIDEFRFFKKALTQDEILKNYNHTLSGAETDLSIYWPMDEGIENGQTIVYDFSRQNGIANGMHGLMRVAATSRTDVPTEEQLSLMAYTDADGNFMIRGVGFSGEGTNYVITPTLGIHQFSPSNKSRYFSINSLVHTGVDFEDVSSFPVSGQVFYENTTVPVDGAYLYVDGIMASRDGEPVMTNSRGEFSVDVPIGDHFVQVKKNGHTFVGGGRYPADPNDLGLRHTFDRKINNLTFFDNTLVTVAGRVAGGDIEYQKPLGLNQGMANIGRAVISIEQENERGQLNVVQDANSTVISYDPSQTQRDFEAQIGSAYVPAGKNYIVVETDPTTGEWAVLLPPLSYKVTSINIPSNPSISSANFSLPIINASNPNVEYIDSVEMGNDWNRFKYNASAKMNYKAPSVLKVTELRKDDKGNVYSDGFFGIPKYTVKDLKGNKHDVTIYEPGSGYTFGYPVYEELGTYQYSIYAYEEYVNKDGAEPVTDLVPLSGSQVTIKNQFAHTTSVYHDGTIHEMKDDAFELGDDGKAVYQFTVGYPNIQAPYTRGLSISYNNAGVEVPWSQNGTFQAIVLGALPTGYNFVTQGPDEITMILRDPPGSNSYATFTQGSVSTTTKSLEYNLNINSNTQAKIYAGIETSTATGVGFMVIQDIENKATVTQGTEISFNFNTGHDWITSTSTTRDISTSAEPDFVGDVGDLFIGSAKNLIFGASNAVDIYWNETTNQPELKMDEALAVGEKFTTGFVYTQNYVKEVLIPNFIELRNNLLQRVSSTSGISKPLAGAEPIYVTTLTEEDPKFGTSNNDKDIWGDKAISFNDNTTGIYQGPSYTMILPEDYKTRDFQDMVNFYNQQIKKWEKVLEANEEAKVTAIQNRDTYLKENHSFDGGSAISASTTNEKGYTHSYHLTEELNITIGVESGARCSGVGIGFEIMETFGNSLQESWVWDTSTSSTIAYSLVENGPDDYLSVDVFDAPDGYGPIFYTRAGATSCPYEDEVQTEYFMPGTVIMQKTIQVEKPEIEAQNPLITGIPAGGKGTFQVKIFNNSDTKEYCWYNLNVIDTSNPDGLVVLMDGVNINKGRSILVPAGETLYKTMTVEQSNPAVMNYENVKLRISSQCQTDNTGVFPEIADTTEISAFFQPSCSEVRLAASQRLINTSTMDTKVKMSISGYNYSMATLRGIKLQYRSLNDADFTTLQEYVKDSALLANDPNLKIMPPLTGTNTLDYTIDFADETRFADKTYIFRAITMCGYGDVYNESEEVEIVRDMSRPQLIATPSPASGIFRSGDNISITFNEDIQNSILNSVDNFTVAGILNDSKVAHNVALNLSGDNTAKTDATIDLTDKSFTTSMWLNYSADGRLLHHGTAAAGFALDIENGKLAVSVLGDKKTSVAALPKNKWIYLNVSLNTSTDVPTLNAAYAEDASTVTLLSNEQISTYDGNGPIALGGNGIIAKVQELAIWNKARSISEAQGDMYTSKNQYTDGILSYWPMSEGHGDMAADNARARNLTLPSQNAWWVNGENYVLNLDGKNGASAYIAELNTQNYEDYMLEAWFKAETKQAGTATILATGEFDIRLDESGQLALALLNKNGEALQTFKSTQPHDLRDGQWHHLAFNVLKSTKGSGVVYLDGQPHIQEAATSLPVLSGQLLHMGGNMYYDEETGTGGFSQFLNGAIDEVRLWKGRRSIEIIRENMHNRVAPNSDGLVAYYPMERQQLDEYQQIVTTSSTTEAVTEDYNIWNFNDQGSPADTELTSQGAPPLKVAPTMTNVAFSFVASERQIKIDLTEEPYKTEGCQIYITAKNVRDANGNTALPVTWLVYVQQNNLRWAVNEMAVSKYGQTETTFSVDIENKGAQTETWSLSNLPSWLTADEAGGTLSPLEKKSINFTVSDALSIGSYDATVFLTGMQGIPEPLRLAVSSEGSTPNWQAVPGEYTMNVVGQLVVNGVISNDPRDMVAAFRGNDCVGIAQPQYFSRYDAYYVMMNIFGDEEAPLTYKAYDASTGQIYASVDVSNTAANSFEPDKAVGTLTNPVVFTPLNEIEQDLSLDKAAWKWFSIYAEPKVNNMDIIFKESRHAIHTLTDGNATLIDWQGPLSRLENNKMYKLQSSEPYVQTFVGEPTDPSAIDINLAKGWSWIGYPCQASNSLNAAFADAQPNEGDMVKSQTSFALYTGGEWVGTLTAMQPGEGYMYSNTGNAKTFRYPKPSMSGRTYIKAKYAKARQSSEEETEVVPCESNMTMIAVVMDGSRRISNAQVSVFAGDELRGLSSKAVIDDTHFLTIGGQSGQTELLQFVVQTDDGEYLLTQKQTFVADAQMGSIDKPHMLQLSQATPVRNLTSGNQIESICIYDASGALVRRINNTADTFTNSYLRGLPKGAYIVKTKYADGQTSVQKIIN